MDVKKLLCTTLREKPETKRASRKLGNIDFSKLKHMGLNENVFGASPKAIVAMQEEATKGSYYGDFSQSALKNAIAEHFGLDSSYVLTGAGSSALTDALGSAFLEPGDELLLCMPSFPAIIDTAQMNGASVKIIPLKDDLTYDMDGLLDAITDKTKMVYICNPNNPTGTYIGKEKLMDFASKCPDHVIQVYDEAYIEFATAPDCEEMLDGIKLLPEKPIILLKTFSKFYGMAGIRAGYILAQPELIEWLGKCGTAFCLNRVAQVAAIAAINDTEHGNYVRAAVAKWRNYLIDNLKDMGCTVYDSQTNFIFYDTHLNPDDVAMKMMERGIMISSQAGMNRVSVGLPEHCEEFIKIMKDILEEGTVLEAAN